MSRTIRRKNFEKIHNQISGSKINGFYTTWDTLVEYPCKNGHGGCQDYRAMTKEEIADRYWGIHGESKSNRSWGPNHKDREVENQDLKTFNKRELRKWQNLNGEYEPMVIPNLKKSAYMAWW
jgi:hypothetical protein